MREVAPGDLIFSFIDTRIIAVGIAQSYCWESPKPSEFGTAGEYWENIGWKVKVSFTKLTIASLRRQIDARLGKGRDRAVAARLRCLPGARRSPPQHELGGLSCPL